MASAALETFIDESVRISQEHGYNPTAFNAMRDRYGTVPAIERLVSSGEIQSGFKKLERLGLLNWTIEAAVLKFANEFSSSIRAAAEWRLQQAKKEADGT